MLARALVDVAGATGSAVVGIIAAETNNTAITVTAIGAVLGFAGLLVNQVIRAQKAIWLIVRAKDDEIAGLRESLHYAEWEQQRLRWSYGERPTDPGPYSPRSER